MKQISVLFVCLGNICRSPMAEAIFRHLVNEKGLENHIQIDSAATGTWEHGNPVHAGTRQRLAEENILVEGMYSRPLNIQDLEADYIIGMDDSNIININKHINGRSSGQVMKLMDLTDNTHDILDPYFTDDFDTAYEDILKGCQALLAYIEENDLEY